MLFPDRMRHTHSINEGKTIRNKAKIHLVSKRINPLESVDALYSIGKNDTVFRPCALHRLSLAQDGSGKSFVHSMCGPYLQGCGNKLRVLVCIDIEHLTPTHANDVNAVVVIG